MIYEHWYLAIPDNWKRIGTLYLGKKLITPACSEVVFFAMNENAYQEIIVKLGEFRKTLPKDVVFRFAEE